MVNSLKTYDVYALTPNGREIRELEVPHPGDSEGRPDHVYAVQPRDDNYWLICRTPEAALAAFYAPWRFAAMSDRLRARYRVTM